MKVTEQDVKDYFICSMLDAGVDITKLAASFDSELGCRILDEVDSGKHRGQEAADTFIKAAVTGLPGLGGAAVSTGVDAAGSLLHLMLLGLIAAPPIAGIAAGYATGGLTKYDKADEKSKASRLESDMFSAATERVLAAKARARAKNTDSKEVTSTMDLGLT